MRCQVWRTEERSGLCALMRLGVKDGAGLLKVRGDECLGFSRKVCCLSGLFVLC